MENRKQVTEAERKTSDNKSSRNDQSLESVIKSGVAGDPVLSFFYVNRKPIITAIIVIFAGYYIYMKFQNSLALQARQAGGVLYELQDLFEKYNNSLDNPSEDESKVAENAKVLNDIKQKIKVLEIENDPYKYIAKAYEAIISLNNGNAKDAISFINSSDNIKDDNFYLEVALLTLNKKLFNVKDQKEFALKNIEKLVVASKYVNVSAYKFLEQNSELKTDKLNQLKNEIATKNPEFASLVE